MLFEFISVTTNSQNELDDPVISIVDAAEFPGSVPETKFLFQKNLI